MALLECIIGIRMKTFPEIRFCVRYLLEHGINANNFDDVVVSMPPEDEDDKFELVKVPKKTSFFDNLAEKLRELWPPGEKEGKYPWRDSVGNISRRLQLLWKERFPNFKENENSIEQCLTVARRYLAKFENDTKYMQTLKYFILKQEPISKGNGHLTYINKSRFADMLEGKADEDAIMNEWDFLVNDASIGEGEII